MASSFETSRAAPPKDAAALVMWHGTIEHLAALRGTKDPAAGNMLLNARAAAIGETLCQVAPEPAGQFPAWPGRPVRPVPAIVKIWEVILMSIGMIFFEGHGEDDD